jgi:putative membrane protein
MYILINILVKGLAVYLTAWLLPGIAIAGYWRAVLVAVALAIVNWTVKPILVLLTLPVTFLTLGLFLFVINALMVMLVSWAVKGFEVQSFWWALAFSLVLAIVGSVFDMLFNGK